MSALSTITALNSQINKNAVPVLLGVQAFGEHATGQEKQSVFVRAMTGIEVATGNLETHENPLVRQYATLANMLVTIAKMFKHPAFVPVAGQ